MSIRVTTPRPSMSGRWFWNVSVDYENLDLPPFNPYGNAASKEEAWRTIEAALGQAVQEAEAG